MQLKMGSVKSYIFSKLYAAKLIRRNTYAAGPDALPSCLGSSAHSIILQNWHISFTPITRW